MIKKILITSVGGDIGGNIVQILLKQNIFKCNLVITDINSYVFSEKFVDKFYKVSKTNSSKYLKEIQEIVIKHNIDLIIPSTEEDIIFFDMNKKYFFDNNIKLLINNSNIIKIFLDKYKTSIVLNEINVQTPLTYNFDKYNDELSFPLILKAIKSTASKLIKIINNEKELENSRNLILNKKDFIIQKYIATSDEEYTTAIYRDSNMSRVITFKRLLAGDKTGYAEIKYSKTLEEYANKIANAFSLNGSINIQSRMYDNDFYIFEINPRISSTVFIRDHFDFKDLVWWICDLLEIDFLESVKENHQSGIAIIGYTYNFYK